MGNGVPNQGPFQHRRGGAGIVGYRFRYHDQMVTGNSWLDSVEISPAAYATIRAAAKNTQAAFDTAVAASAWGVFFATHTGIDKAEARYGVMDLS